ncbi:MAG: 2-oxoglutarate/2-oxoacid ferredoxin oxidoreductase subunit alpha [Methanothermococcus sp.]|jgi:2-oxoglutarate ferredoxin oxidoreductase subunit alpha|uniref:2-oxoacid:acceptor oxidoreductase subunit alpha n=1 Tax=Methanothermococcus TaxID=155862 RepID=UPI000375E2A9|nr:MULTISPECIES: 2-oxoacid:acceptor oxidoreductase subunit alpha [Methanothermococcus]MDK2791117.1 2-oxoglutarate/2-oxoacid ferredoxin oxidoreductase subunit alpha [Methanothermococcus sp.]MDK2988012.1 2-oxoglutarate/2-oxoacid ferredoxin oxidoreductase subunit alpha [Methanothermococcus sp.]
MTKVEFMQGNMACVEGAIKAGCRFFGGYPITPSTEIAEGMAKKLPKVGGNYVQMEDEIGSMAAVIGASWAGSKSMTATSGPGFSLMQENIGYAFMTETPCVIVNIQRGGPSTGQPTAASQGDMMQVRWGSHGDYEPIVLVPSSVQEMYDFTIMAFNYSEKYRVPVFLMSDEIVGHMREKVVLHDNFEIINRELPDEKPCKKPYPFDKEVPPMPVFGEGYNIHITGLTHNEYGYPDVSAETHDKLVRRICNKILKNKDDIVKYEGKYLDSETIFVCYGTPSRTVKHTVEVLREEGVDVGYIRLMTVYPFPGELISGLKASKIIVPEMNLGQIHGEVMKYAKCDVVLVDKIGGELHRPEELMKLVKSEN